MFRSSDQQTRHLQSPAGDSRFQRPPQRAQRVLSPPGARSPDQWVIPAGMELDAAPLLCSRPAGAQGASCCPQCPGQLCQSRCHPRGRAGQSPGEGNSIHASSELRDAWKMCSCNTVAPRETKKVALCSLSAARLLCWGPGPQSQGWGQAQQGGRWFEAYKKSAAG